MNAKEIYLRLNSIALRTLFAFVPKMESFIIRLKYFIMISCNY